MPDRNARRQHEALAKTVAATIERVAKEAQDELGAGGDALQCALRIATALPVLLTETAALAKIGEFPAWQATIAARDEIAARAAREAAA